MLLKKTHIDLKKMNGLVDSLVSVVRSKLPINEETEYQIRLVSKELLTNIIKYSGADDILFSASLENRVLTINIEDNSNGFDYQEIMDRNVAENDFLMQESGRGVFLVRSFAHDMKYNPEGNKVEVTLVL